MYRELRFIWLTLEISFSFRSMGISSVAYVADGEYQKDDDVVFSVVYRYRMGWMKTNQFLGVDVLVLRVS